MKPDVTTGNAAIDGQWFNHWFIGDLQKWSEAREDLPRPMEFGLRDTRILEIKWGVHEKGETRPTGWSNVSEKVTLSLLVQGNFLLRYRNPGNRKAEWQHTLRSAGDYAIWQETIEHTWTADEDSIVLTVRWKDAEST